MWDVGAGSRGTDCVHKCLNKAMIRRLDTGVFLSPVFPHRTGLMNGFLPWVLFSWTWLHFCTQASPDKTQQHKWLVSLSHVTNKGNAKRMTPRGNQIYWDHLHLTLLFSGGRDLDWIYCMLVAQLNMPLNIQWLNFNNCVTEFIIT